MGDDEARPSSAVRITASDDTVEAEELEPQQVPEAEELEETPKEEAEGWAEQARSMVEEEDTGPDQDAGRTEADEGEMTEGEADESSDGMEQETETTEAGEAPEGDAPAEGAAKEADIGVATLVVGSARTPEEEEVAAGEGVANTLEEGPDETYPQVEEESVLFGPRRVLPAFLMAEDGELDRRVLFALSAAIILLVASGLIYLVLNKPLSLQIGAERLGDEMRYDVSGTLSFEYGDLLQIPGVDLNISGADLTFSGALTMGTREETNTVVDGFQYPHTKTYTRYTAQNLDDIDGQLRYEGGNWDELPGRLATDTASRDHIDELSYTSVKTVRTNEVTYTVAAKDSGLQQEAITYVQSAPAGVIELYRQLDGDGKLTEGEEGITSSGGLRWSVERGETLLGHETLVLVVQRKVSERDLTVPFISGFFRFSLVVTLKLWMSEASPYPLKLRSQVALDKPKIPDIGLELPAWAYPKLEFRLDYTATAATLQRGDRPLEVRVSNPPAELKHKLAREQGQFQAWSADGAPQLGEYDLLKTGFEESFDLQRAIEVAKNETLLNDLDEYLQDHQKQKPFVVEAHYNGSRVVGVTTGTKWNFTMGFHDPNKGLSDQVKGHQDLVNRSLGTPFFVSGQKLNVRNPAISRETLLEPLTLRGMELVLAANEHSSQWVFDDGRFDYTRSNLTLTEIIGTPSFDYMELFTAFQTQNLNEVIDDLVNEQRSYGYLFEKGDTDNYQRARVDAVNGQLTYLVTQSTYSQL